MEPAVKEALIFRVSLFRLTSKEETDDNQHEGKRRLHYRETGAETRVSIEEKSSQ